MRFIEVPGLLWYGGGTLKLKIPEGWDLTECRMAGHDAPPMSPGEVASAFEDPIGTERIRDLARGKDDAVIIFDDMTRGTRVYELVPYIIEEIRRGGIPASHIRFVMALGVHGARTRVDFSQKIGEDVVSKFPIYNHNPFHNLVYLGETSRGTPVHLNSVVARCDLKIGVGSIVPHPMVGFGGGSKIILPGVVSMETIYHNHVTLGGYGPGVSPSPSSGMGVDRENVIFLDMEESAEMAGLDVKVDALLNGKSETCGLFVGEPIAEHKLGFEEAKEHYVTQPLRDPDVVITNAFTKSNESTIALWPVKRWIRNGGTVVLISNTPEGQVTHYLYGKFGLDMGGTAWTPKSGDVPYSKLIVYSKYTEVDPHLEIARRDEMVWMDNWDEVLKQIKADHGDDVKAAFYPCGEIQFPPGGIPAL